MSGETNLQRLLQQMSPERNPGEYIIVSRQDKSGIAEEDILCSFKEKEGVSLVLPRAVADGLGFFYDFVGAWITLRVHSSLSAVGLTAAVTGELARHQISCNMIAGYYHDHIIVDIKDADKAVQVLKALSQRHSK